MKIILKIDDVFKVKVQIALLLFLIYILLFWSYNNPIYEFYKYFGFNYVDPSSFRMIISISLVFLNISLVTLLVLDELTYIFSLFIIIFLIFPSLVIFVSGSSNPLILFSHEIYLFILIFVNYNKIDKYNDLSVVQPANVSMRDLLIVSLLAVIPFVFVFSGNINLKNLLLEEVYETRAIQKENNNLYTAYMYSWLSRVILPIGLVMSLTKKKYFAAALFFVLILFLFLVGAHKSVFFGLVILIVFYKYDYMRKINLFVKILFALFFLAFVEFKLFGTFILTTIFTRRVFFIPAYLDQCYFDFFAGKPLFWSSSIMKYFVDYPYSLGPTNLISAYYFNHPDAVANNGIVSDGYMNAGLAGVLFNVIIVSLFLKYIRISNISHRYFGVIFMMFISLLSSSLSTVFLTHGLMVMLLLVHYILKNTRSLDDNF